MSQDAIARTFSTAKAGRFLGLATLWCVFTLVFGLAGCNPGTDSINEHALHAVEEQSVPPTQVVPSVQPRSVKIAAKVNARPDRAPFLLGPDDIVKIIVLNQTDLDATQPVRPDGKIAFFPAGDIQAGGRTVEQLRDEIVRRLRSPSSHSYRLGIQDIVDITVYSHDDFKSTQTIGPDGNISVLPGGSIRAAGRTVDELSKEIAQRVSSVIENPIVNVSVKEYKSQPLFIADPIVNVVIQEINSQRVLGARGGAKPWNHQTTRLQYSARCHITGGRAE